MARYVNPHQSQYQSGASSITRSAGCTWTSAANGADAATGGELRLSPDEVHELVDNAEELNPATPGWAIPDLVLAMARVDVPVEDRSGRGWAAVEAAHGAGLYVVVQGDSDQFGDHTCSGAFDGDHAVGIHPDEDGQGYWRLDDPICGGARFESPRTLRLYAEKLRASVNFAAYTDPVPQEGAMAIPRIDVTGSFRGRARVLGDNRPAVQLNDGQVFQQSDGTLKDAYATGSLVDPYTIGDTVVGAGTAVVLVGLELAFMLVDNVELVADDDVAGDADYVPIDQVFIRRSDIP